MDFYDAIEKRKSIHEFKENKVEDKKIENIISAAMRAPSWKNKTSYKILIVKDEKEKKLISEAVLNKDDLAAKSIDCAPVLMVVVGDPNLSGEMDGKEYYLVDGAIAMEHIILAATAEDLGSCWIGAMDEEKVKNILGIPNDFKVIGMTPIGYIKECKEHYEKKDESKYVFLDKWQNSYKDEKQKQLSFV